MSDKEKTVVVLVAVAVFLGGYLLGNQRRVNASEAVIATLQRDTHDHKHGTIDVSADTAIPRVDLVIHEDAMSGRNLEIVTENFRFAPEHASSDHVAGEGHAHLYVDGKKIARVYGRWFHLSDPAPGTHSIRVTLNSNSHQDFAVGGEVIEDIETLTVPER